MSVSVYIYRKCLTWVVDPNENFYYYWTGVVTIAAVYNLLVVIARYVHAELSERAWWIFWIFGDLFADAIYGL